MKGGKALRMLARSPEVVFLNPPCALGGSIRGKSVGLLLLLGTCLDGASARRVGGGDDDVRDEAAAIFVELDEVEGWAWRTDKRALPAFPWHMSRALCHVSNT